SSAPQSRLSGSAATARFAQYPVPPITDIAQPGGASTLRVCQGCCDVPGNRDDEFVVGDQWCRARFGERYVGGVVGGKPASCPSCHARQFRLLEFEPQFIECGGQFDQCAFAPPPAAPGNVDDLETKQRRREDRELTLLEGHAECTGGIEMPLPLGVKPLQKDRGVEDDLSQRASRSARIALVESPLM